MRLCIRVCDASRIPIAFAIASAIGPSQEVVDWVAMLPTVPQLEHLRDLLLMHAVMAGTTQSRVLSHLFRQVIEKGQATDIGWDRIYPLYTLEEKAKHDPLVSPKGTVSSLMRDLMGTINVFYVGNDKKNKPPNPHNVSAHFRPSYLKEGNYTLNFEPWEAPPVELELVPLFWKPHLPPGRARTLYPEPIFLKDEDGTYFRNAKMGTSCDPKPLGYLKYKGQLEPGYSYVPAGIVRSMVTLGKTLRRFNRQLQPDDYYSCEPVNPSISRDSSEHDLILLATPTSIKLVSEFIKNRALTFDNKGIQEINNPEPFIDGSEVAWGICTRMRENFRAVTIIAAKHGRSVEAITRFLTIRDELPGLMRWMQRTEHFPKDFQILFSINVSTTDEGPSFEDAKIYIVYVDGKRIDPPA